VNASRRHLLKAAALSSGAAMLSGCERTISTVSAAFGNATPDHLMVGNGAEIDDDFHLLSRAAFGPWPGDLERLKQMGRKTWLEEQLNHESINDHACDLRAQRFASLRVHPGEAYNWKKPTLRDEITRHSLLQAVYSQRQLFEVMVEFWTDHLNIDLEKGDCIYFKAADDRDVIRKHALGNFHQLIRASATSPAMLVYLDGRSNKVTKAKPVPNENYAREIMELHTLGVNGGYTQKDIYEAARCLSGWTVNLLKDKQGVLKRAAKGQLLPWGEPPRGVSYFNLDLHDDGEKTVLGHVIKAGGGDGDLDRLVDIVCAHPGTARHIALKLCRRFVSYDPPGSLVQRVAETFSQTMGDIKSTLRVILNSEEFMASRGLLLKRPFRFIVSALRATAADTHAHKPLTDWLHRMGQGLFQYPTPDGYPDEESPWLGTLLWRWNFALALAGGKIQTVELDAKTLQHALEIRPQKHDAPPTAESSTKLFAHFTGRKPQAHETEAASSASNDAESLGIILASPAFQRF